MPSEGLVLTGDGGAGVEGRGHLRVQLDQQVALQLDLLVPLLDLLLHPVGESVAEDCVRDVDDPLLGQLAHLLPVGVVVEGLRVLSEEVCQARHRERLVLRHLQVAARVVLDVCSEKIF